MIGFEEYLEGVKYKTTNLSSINHDDEQKHINEFYKSSYSDIVKLTYYEDLKLNEMFKDAGKDADKDAPLLRSDIIFAKTIPIRDIKIICDETEYMNKEQNKKGKFIHEYRVKIFDDYEKIVDTVIQKKCRANVGIAEISSNGMKTKFLLSIVYGENAISINPSLFNSDFIKNFLAKLMIESPDNYMGFLAATINEYLTTWYNIQIALLHPKIKEIFSNPSNIPVSKNNKLQGKYTRKTEYVKYHLLKKQELESKLYTGKNKKHCLCWYVIGHWREYKSGQKIFIRGYWKGLLRELKQNQDDGRERIIS